MQVTFDPSWAGAPVAFFVAQGLKSWFPVFKTTGTWQNRCLPLVAVVTGLAVGAVMNITGADHLDMASSLFNGGAAGLAAIMGWSIYKTSVKGK